MFSPRTPFEQADCARIYFLNTFFYIRDVFLCASFQKKMSKIPDSFGFPFEPYSIQKDFMTSLYRTLSQDKIGIFESPTGTVIS
jgi:hypothetical protein